VRELPGGLGGRLRARGGARRQSGPGGDVSGFRERLVGTGIREALTVDKELSVGYFSFTVADGSKATPSLRRVLSARGRRLRVS
jgi:hypothetical protein